ARADGEVAEGGDVDGEVDRGRRRRGRLQLGEQRGVRRERDAEAQTQRLQLVVLGDVEPAVGEEPGDDLAVTGLRLGGLGALRLARAARAAERGAVPESLVALHARGHGEMLL